MITTTLVVQGKYSLGKRGEITALHPCVQLRGTKFTVREQFLFSPWIIGVCRLARIFFFPLSFYVRKDKNERNMDRGNFGQLVTFFFCLQRRRWSQKCCRFLLRWKFRQVLFLQGRARRMGGDFSHRAKKACFPARSVETTRFVFTTFRLVCLLVMFLLLFSGLVIP